MFWRKGACLVMFLASTGVLRAILCDELAACKTLASEIAAKKLASSALNVRGSYRFRPHLLCRYISRLLEDRADWKGSRDV